MVKENIFWNGKRVLVTGHTGFKGGWISLWLYSMGADVCGYSLEPTDENIFYKTVYKSGFLGEEIFSDVNNFTSLKKCIDNFNFESYIYQYKLIVKRKSLSFQRKYPNG